MTLYRQWLTKIKENEHQKAALEKEGHTVVIAGPGSGKTRVLAIKIAKLLRDEIAPPKGVACLTYTRMMAKELENRLSSLEVLERPNILIGTIHSFCLQQIIEPFSEIFRLNLPHPIRIAPGPIWNECLDLARKKVVNRGFDPNKDRGFKTNLTKYHLQNIDTPYPEWENQKFATIIQELYTNLRVKNYVDFDFLIGKSIHLLAKEDVVRQSLASKYAWLAVDEYQDLGYPLFRIVNLLIENTSIKLFAIGDPDQSIFDFAGTDPKYLINLAERSEVQPIIKLNKNYRSTIEITEAASSVITPYCSYESEKRGGMVRVYESTLSEQGQRATWLVQKYISLKIQPERIAVLHPWRDKDGLEGINVIANSLDGIQYSLDKNPYYDRNMAIIRWLEDLAFWCLEGFDTPSSDINGRTFEALVSTWGQILQGEIDMTDRLRLTDFVWKSKGQDLPMWVWLNSVSDKLKLNTNLLQYAQIFPDDVAEFDNLRKITRPGSELESMTLRKFLDMTRGVQLTTIHSSKGMEFDVVIVAGVERIWNDDNGRRLLYVALTRAERDACLIYSKVYPEWSPSTPLHILNLINKCKDLPFFKHFPLKQKTIDHR